MTATRAGPFIMTAILPSEVTEIVQETDWRAVEASWRDPLFPGLPPPPSHPSMAPTNQRPLWTSWDGESRRHRNHREPGVFGEGVQDKSISGAMPALLATCFALYHTHCVSQRNSPFPGPFRYELRDLPLTRMLRLTAAAAWRDAGGCRDQGLASVHAFLVPAVMDICPELFCPEQRNASDGVLRIVHGGCGSGDSVEGSPAGLETCLEAAFVRKAVGTLPTATSMATDVLRELLACPTAALVTVGEAALKGVLPKAQRRSAVASLSCAVWLRLYAVHPNPQGMEAWTLNALLQRGSQAALPSAVSYDTMCREPVLVFRCSGETLSCPYLLRVLLRVLRSLLLASERTIDQAVVAKQRRWEMVRDSARRKNQKAAAEAVAEAAAAAVTAAAVAATAAANSGGLRPPPPPPPQGSEDLEEKTSGVDGRMMLLVQQAIVARCLLVVALGGATNSGGSGDDRAANAFEGDLASQAQCCKLVCEFLQVMVSECPPLLHLLLRQTLPTEALVLLLDGVPACRGATRHLGDVMEQQSWESRAFGVRAAALLAERFPTEESCRLCKVALYILSSMCDPEARAPRGLSAHAGGVGGGGAVAGATPPAALLTCGMPPSGLVRETFSYAINVCQAFPSLTSDAVSRIESILQRQDLAKMLGTKGGAKLRKRLGKVLTSIRANQGGHSTSTSGGSGVGSQDVDDVSGAAGGLHGLVTPAAKRPKVG